MNMYQIYNLYIATKVDTDLRPTLHTITARREKKERRKGKAKYNKKLAK